MLMREESSLIIYFKLFLECSKGQIIIGSEIVIIL